MTSYVTVGAAGRRPTAANDVPKRTGPITNANARTCACAGYKGFDSPSTKRSAGWSERKLQSKATRYFSWFDKAPGLNNEIALLAWTHYGESPLIDAT